MKPVRVQSNTEDMLFLKLINDVELSCRDRICDPHWCTMYSSCHDIIDRTVAYQSSMGRFDDLAYVRAFNNLYNAGIISPTAMRENERQRCRK